jgi:phosphate starvation-inducible membrane PsiE
MRNAQKKNNMEQQPPTLEKILQIEKSIIDTTNSIGNFLVSIFHQITLFCIGALTVWSSVHTFLGILDKNVATIQDLLLLFIYLEIGAMVGIYFKTNHMPLRFLIYVAITAVTRLVIDLVGKHEGVFDILMLGATILALAISNAIVRYASYKFPSNSTYAN